jgi:hypothetical protein
MPQEQHQGASTPELETVSFSDFEAWRQTPATDQAATEEEAPAAATARTAPDSGTDDGQEEEEEPQQPEKGGKGVQKRIDELTKARRAEERKNAELTARLEALERGSRPATKDSANQDPQQQQQTAADGAPKLENFDSYQEYYRALVNYELDQREAAKTAGEAQKSALDSWNAKQEKARGTHTDYDEVLEGAEIPNTPALPAVRQFLSESDLGAELLYTLAKTPAEVARIMALSPARALAELGKLEAKLTPAATPDKPQPRKETATPAPPRRIDGRFSSTKSVDDPDLEFEEFERRRNAQLTRR